MKSLRPRLLTAVIGIPILLIVLFISELWHPFVGIVIGAFSAFMTGEYLHARKMLYKFHLSIPCMLFTFLLSVLVTTKYLYVLIFAFILTVFAVMIFKHEKTNYADVAYSVFGTFLISFGMSAVPIPAHHLYQLLSAIYVFSHYRGWQTQAAFLSEHRSASTNFARKSALKRLLRAQSAEYFSVTSQQ